MNEFNPQDSTEIIFPYAEILSHLIQSVMDAQLKIIESIEAERSFHSGVSSTSNQSLHSIFQWLTEGNEIRDANGSLISRYTTRDGRDRHIFDAPDPHWSFAVSLRQALGDKPANQIKPTRISFLIKQSFNESDVSFDENKKITNIKLTSPLNIALNILTDPESPGSYAYPFFTLRNYIYKSVQAQPSMTDQATSSNGNGDGNINDSVAISFSVDSVTEALGRVWTSFRPRALSLGKDPIAPQGRNKADTVVRAWLALKGIALLYFSDIEKCKLFLKSGQVYPSEQTEFMYEIQKSPSLDSLPDPGAIINELWGIPLPIRGADVLFRGGLRFPESGGLVLAIHGDPGAGKTSLALALGAHLAPFGMKTLFITADGKESDLRAKVSQLVPDRVRRLSFFPSDEKLKERMHFTEIDARDLAHGDCVKKLTAELNDLSELTNRPRNRGSSISLPCHGMIVIDGLHDLFAESERDSVEKLYKFVASCRALRMLVLLTSGGDWEKNSRLDYLVDISMRLDQEHISDYGAKPDRRVTITKTRHQLSALGKHGFRLDGHKGVRFSPQINYGLDLKSIFKANLPDDTKSVRVLQRILDLKQRSYISNTNEPLGTNIKYASFNEVTRFCHIYPGSHVFINGRGSSGKAGLALKIACSPTFRIEDESPIIKSGTSSNVLVISFLYPDEYYRHLHKRLVELQKWEYPSSGRPKNESEFVPSESPQVRLKVIQLYPGYIRPDDLFNRIEWELEAARLNGLPYDSMVIDGLHNIPIQFPELEKHSLLWPQLYQSLRTREITVVTTHTTLIIPNADSLDEVVEVDDRRSEPLRHALVQKTDFQLEIDPIGANKHISSDSTSTEDLFSVRVLSAIKQPVPKNRAFWSRNQLVLFSDPETVKQGMLPLSFS